MKKQLAPTQAGLLLVHYRGQPALRSPPILLEHGQQPFIKALPIIDTDDEEEWFDNLGELDDQFTQLKRYSKVSRDLNRPGAGKSAGRALSALKKFDPITGDRLSVNATQERTEGTGYDDGGKLLIIVISSVKPIFEM